MESKLWSSVLLEVMKKSWFHFSGATIPVKDPFLTDDSFMPLLRIMQSLQENHHQRSKMQLVYEFSNSTSCCWHFMFLTRRMGVSRKQGRTLRQR